MLHSEAGRLTDDALEAAWLGEDVLDLEQRAAESVAAAAAGAIGVKVFPAVASRVMQLLAGPSVTIGALREPIEQDPSLAGRLLRIANSVAYARSAPCRSIDDAVLRLGHNQVRAIVAGVAAFGMFPATNAAANHIHAHGAGVAALIGVLGREWRGGAVGDLFLSGLLHDFGKLAVIQVDALDYDALREETQGRPDRAHVLEAAHLGYDHAALGASILHGWNFDPDVIRTVAWHHHPGRAYAEDRDVGGSVALLRLADAIDLRLRSDPDLDLAFVDELARGGECTYLSISAEILSAMWSKLRDAHEELQRVLID